MTDARFYDVSLTTAENAPTHEPQRMGGWVFKKGIGRHRGRDYAICAWVQGDCALKMRFVSQDEPRSLLRRVFDLPPRRREYAVGVVTNGAGRELLTLSRLELKECRT